MDGPDDDAQASAAESVDRRQLLLVAACFGALVVAAALAPTPVTPEMQTPGAETPTEPPQSDTGGSTGGGGGADGTPGGGGGDTGEGGAIGTPDEDTDRSRVVVEGGEGEPAPIPGETAPETDGCAVVLEDEPIPGTQATVRVYVDRVPVSGVPVRFGGDPVGRTGERGRVDGPVPYDRTLAVGVGLDADCKFYYRQFDERESALGGASAGGPPAAPDPADVSIEWNGASTPASVDVPRLSQGSDEDTRRLLVAQSGNDTGTYTVRGDLNVTFRGDAYPGTGVTLVAVIEGVPVPEANVTVGETSAGRTGQRGRTDLTVPDGNQSVPVTVGRGDFRTTTTLDVLLLTASVDPREGYPVPGERAVVEARIDERPTDDVRVRVAGQRAGATDLDGKLGFSLPLWTAGNVVVSTERQSVTVPLWELYVPTVLNLFVLLSVGVVGVVGTHLFRGPETAARVGLGWAALAVADLALVVGEVPGLVLALAGMGLVALVHQHRRVRAGGERAVGVVAGLVMVVRRTALTVTVAVERVVDRLRRFLARTWRRLTSFERFVAWVGGLVRKVVVTVWLYLTLRRAGVALFALAELAVATVRWGHEGLVASVAGLAVIAALVALYRRDDPAPPPDVDEGDGGAAGGRVRRVAGGDSDDDGERVLSIRELWRRFAQWVVPGSWRTKTPGEVARAATERGFPREPVEALTDAFRDVEYGAEPATSRRQRAKAAFDRLARTREEDEE